MNRFHITPLAAALALGISATAGVAQEHTTFDLRGDTTKGDDLNYEAFEQPLNEWGVYDAWDTDRDEMLTRDEFNRGVYSTYDRNADEILDPDEYSDLRRDQMFRRDWRANQ